MFIQENNILSQYENKVIRKEAERCSILSLPPEVLTRIMNYLEVRDIIKFSLVSKYIREVSNYPLLIRAKEYGFFISESSAKDVKIYLSTLFKSVDTLTKLNVHSAGSVPSMNYFNGCRQYRPVTLSEGFFKFVKNKIAPDQFCPERTLACLLKNAINDKAKFNLHYKSLKFYDPLFKLSYLTVCFFKKELLDDRNAYPILYEAPFQAIRSNAPYGLKLLLLLGVDPNKKSCDGDTLLHKAVVSCTTQQEMIVTYLLEFGANPNVTNRKGLPPLSMDIKSLKIASLLLQHGADPNYQEPRSGKTLLHYAVEKGQLETIHALLEKKANANIKDKEGKTPLYLEMTKKSPNLEIVSLLLSYQADPQATSIIGLTPVTVNTSRAEITKYLLEQGVDLNFQSYVDGSTPLHFAVKRGQADILELFLKKGANPQIKDDEGRTPLSLALLQDDQNEEVILLLQEYANNVNIFAEGVNIVILENEANSQIPEYRPRYEVDPDYVDLKSGETALHRAVMYGEIATVQTLLRLGANSNARNNEGKTPLHLEMSRPIPNLKILSLLIDGKDSLQQIACDGCNPLTRNLFSPEAVAFLLDSGANPNFQNPKDGNSALHYAVEKGYLITSEILLKAGADPNIKNYAGKTPLHQAVSRSFSGSPSTREEIVVLLLKYRANPGLIARNGSTALTFNTSNSNITRSLLKGGADPNFKNLENGFTALHYAVSHGQVNTIRTLLEGRASIEVENNMSMTPLDLARKKDIPNKEKVLALLS